MLAHQRPAIAGGDHHLGRTGLAVPEAVLAGPVDIEIVMGVLDGRDGDAAGGQCRQEADQQGRLAAAAPAGEAEDLHAGFRISNFRSLPSRRSELSSRPVSYTKAGK